MQNISENIDKIGRQVRTVRSNRILKGRAYIWNGIDPGELGMLLLDDCLVVNSSGLQLSVFLFSTMLLCCAEGIDKEQVEEYVPCYPIAPWELGPALRRTTPLNVTHAIPTSHLRTLRWTDSGMYVCYVWLAYIHVDHQDSFEIDWIEKNDDLHTLHFFPTTATQCDQWCSVLQIFIPLIHKPSLVSHSTIGEDDVLLSGKYELHPT